mgnify:CR=1 FL=1|tara:strand:+ start:14376 stop:15152 length:777 start_codon:yes stop_codon:yes gene_type:complete
MFKLITILVLPIIVIGCVEKKQEPELKTDALRSKHFLEFYYPKATYTPGVYDGNPEPPYPDLEEDVKTLEGIDADKDGLRDDLEIWINRNGKDENERNLWRMYVRFNTDTIKSKLVKKDKGLIVLRGDQLTIACGELIFSEDFERLHKLKRQLLSFIENSIERKNFYLKTANAASPFNGGFATSKEIMLMSKCFCSFKIKDKQNVIERFRVFKDLGTELNEQKILMFLKEFEVRNSRGYYENFFGISDYKSCLDIETK